MTDFNFAYLQGSTSVTTSFFRLFGTADVLKSFRLVLSGLPLANQRLLVLFVSSYLRWKILKPGQEKCPLCRQMWLWEHFFTCKKMVYSFGDFRHVFPLICDLVKFGDWPLFFEYLRLSLFDWYEALTLPQISPEEILGIIAMP